MVLCMMMILVMLVAVARSARVQTAVLNMVTEQLSRGLETTIRVDHLHYRFPNQLLVSHVLVEDQQTDTLLYVDTLTARMDFVRFIMQDTLTITQVGLNGGRVNVYQLEQANPEMNLPAMYNYSFLVNAFRQPDKEREPLDINLQVRDIRLRDIAFRYCQWHGDLPAADLQLHNFNSRFIDAEIEHLQVLAHAQTSNGDKPLSINDFEARVCINDSLVSFPKLRLTLPNTSMQVEELAIARAQQPAKTAVSLHVERAVITPYDLRALIPACETMRSRWTMTAEVHGRIDSLEATRLRVGFRNHQLLTGDATILNLPDLENMHVRARCQDLSLNAGTLQDILSNVTGHPVQMPEIVTRLGNMHYHGTLNGQLQDMVLHGTLTTPSGAIRTDGRASANADFTSLYFKGDISTKRFELGQIVPEQGLGTAALRVNMDGHISQQHPFHGQMNACIDLLQYRDYDYHDICFDGHVEAGKRFDGSIRSEDENIQFTFNGDVDLTQGADAAFHFGLELAHLRLGELHLSDKYADSDLRLSMESNITGSTLDQLDGHVQISDLRFARSFDTLQMNKLLVEATPSTHGNERAIRVYSDYVNANIFGRFTFASLMTSVEALATRYFPTVFPDKRRQQLADNTQFNHVDFYCYLSELNRISEVLELPVSIPDKPTIKGYLHDDMRDISLRAVVPTIYVNDRLIENTALSLTNTGPKGDEALNMNLSTTVHPSQVPASQLMGIMQWRLNVLGANDSLKMGLHWDGDNSTTRPVSSTATATPQPTRNNGNVFVHTAFDRYRDLPFISAHVLPSEIMLADSIWWIDDAHVTYNMADTTIIVDHFRIGSEHQFIYANGVASTREADSLYVSLQDINLDYLLSTITDLRKTIWFGGNVTGWATAYALMNKPMFDANVQMLDASINGTFIGDVYANASLDRQTKHVIIRGDAYDPTLPLTAAAIDTLSTYNPSVYDFTQRGEKRYRHVVHVDGEVGGENKAWQLLIYPDSVNLGLVGYWTQSILTNVGGRGSGKVRVWSRKKPEKPAPDVWVEVRARAYDGHVTIPFTGGQYWLNDSVLLDSISLTLPHLTLHDDEGNIVLLNGGIQHDGSWKDLRFDLDVDAQNAIVIDIPNEGDQLYGGKVYGRGHVDILGNNNDVQITANATTTGGHVDISLATTDDAHDNSFIQFVKRDTPATNGKSTPKKAGTPLVPQRSQRSHLGIDLRIDVTPLVDATILLNKQTGDCLNGRGEGNLRLTLNNSDIQMLGDVTLQQGTFGFTFQNVIRREFAIDNGSFIRWSGPIANPELDIRALYKVTASLRDLLGEEAFSVTNRSSVPVNTVLNLTDHLSSPIIRFGLELPSSDQSVADQVYAAINTEEMMTRQVLYLLVFSRFYTPEYLQNTNTMGVNETYSLISSTITGQINSWLGKLTNAVTLGFNFRTDGQGDTSSQEYEANFEIHPVRGLIINGNLGYRYNDIANQPVFGNLDVEYMLTQDGKFRAKAYTHTVDRYSLRQANAIQGIGFIFKHDF